MPVMVDSCVYLDIFTHDPDWFDWSSNAMAQAADSGAIILNSVIYAEISVRFSRIEDLQALLSEDVFEYRQIPREAAFLAGKCFMRYRTRGGRKLFPLPDFFIGAHAAVAKIPLITRDKKRFQNYFPTIEIIYPE